MDGSINSEISKASTSKQENAWESVPDTDWDRLDAAAPSALLNIVFRGVGNFSPTNFRSSAESISCAQYWVSQIHNYLNLLT